MIPVFFVDDCSVSCNSLQDYFLAQGGEIEIAVVFASGAEALAYLNAQGSMLSYLILLAYDLPDMPAVQFAANVRKRDPAIPLVVYRAPEDEQVVAELVAAGVMGCVLKRESLEDLVTTLRAAVCGKPRLPIDLATRLWAYMQRSAVEAFQLNAGEREILILVGEGLKNREIALRLNVAEQTVKNNITNLYKKLDVENRTQLMHKARALRMWLKPTNYTGGVESIDSFVRRSGNSLRRIASPTTL
ncbi:MAG: hypothetical protein Fur0022_06980 [Anaerolineales bacterium]